MTDLYHLVTELPGNFKVRPARIEDATAVTALLNRCDLELKGREASSETELLNEWRSPDFNLETASRVIHTPAGQIIGYADIYYPSVPLRNFLWGRVHPDYRNQGLGTFMLNWGEEAIQTITKQLPPDEKPVMLTYCHEKETPAKALFQNHHMALVRRFYNMQIDFDGPPPPPKFPPGLHLATFAEQGDLAAIWRANNEAFRDHYGHVECPEEKGVQTWQHHIENAQFFDAKLWFLAMDGDEIAGLCLCDPHTVEDADKAHVNNLGVKRPWRKQGLGMALLLHAFGELYKLGRKRVDLGVDATSLTGATRLYEKAGMRKMHIHETYEKPIPHPPAKRP